MASDQHLGLKIKRARERLRWTQAQLGEAVGVSQKSIDNWEHGRRRPRSAIGALEAVLGIHLDAERDDDDGPGTPATVTRDAAEALNVAQRALDDLRQAMSGGGNEANGPRARRAG